MKLSRRFFSNPLVQKVVGITAAEYLRLVWNTSNVIREPANLYEVVEPDMPVIVAMWHGNHLLVPFLKRKQHRFKVLISRSRDGEINATVTNHLKIPAIRASGSHGTDFHRKGGVSGFKAMAAALAQGYNIVLTADVPKVSRIAGPGIIKLAQLSGRPIYPVSITTSRRKELNNWDRTTISFPFSRAAAIMGEPICVTRDANGDALEAARVLLQQRLNLITERALQVADSKTG